MKDNDIIKALACCIDGDCQDCMYGETSQRTCRDDLMRESLDLINRQKAEIERLNDHIPGVKKMVKSETIIEFAERLKRQLNSNSPRGAYLINIVDNLVKEME